MHRSDVCLFIRSYIEGWFLGAYSADTSKPWLFRMLYDQSNPGVTIPLPLMPVENHYLVRNPRDNSIDMFVMEQGEKAGTVSHLWIDNETSLWNNQSVQIEDNTQTNKLTTNSTYIRINNISSNSSTFPSLQISATQEVSVTINGKNYQLKPSTYTNVTSNAVNGLSIINNTQSIDTPIYLISFENSQNAVRIRTVASTQQNMNNLDFSRVPGVSKDDASNYKQFSAGAINIAQELDGTDDISLVPKNSVSSRQLQKSLSGGKKLPDNFFLALSFHEDKPRCFTKREDWLAYVNSGSLAIKPKQLEGFFSDIWDDVAKAVSKDIHAIGDLIKSAENFLDSVGNFVIQKVEDGYHFTIHLAETVIDMIVDTVEHAWAAISTFVKKVFKDIEEVIKYLGYLFNWDDIKTVNNAMKNFINITITQLSHDLVDKNSGVHQFVNRAFDGLKDKLQQFKYPSASSPSSDQIATGNKHSNTLLNTPESGMMRRIIQGGNLNASSSIALVYNGARNDTGNYFPFNDLDNIKQQLLDIANDIKNLNQNNIFNSFEKIANSLVQIFIDIVDVVESGINNMLEQLGEILQTFAKTLNAAIEIPILSFIYKEISGNPLTIMDAFCLIIAIPVTIGTKLIMSIMGKQFDITVFQKLAVVPDYQTLLNDSGITSDTGLFPGFNNQISPAKVNLPSFFSSEAFEVFKIVGTLLLKDGAFICAAASGTGKRSWFGFLIYTTLLAYNAYSLQSKVNISPLMQSKVAAIGVGLIPSILLGIESSVYGTEELVTRWGFTIVSLFFGAVPIVFAYEMSRNNEKIGFNEYDWIDFANKIFNGIEQGSKYLFINPAEEGVPFIVGLLALFMGELLYLSDIMIEGPDRYVG